MPSDVPRENGTAAQRAAARKYGLALRDGSAGFYDGVHRSNGRKVQVKSALFERAAGGPGVLRVWRHNLEQLRDVAGSVVVVVRNPANDVRPILRVEKVAPDLLLELADWRESGQQDMAGRREARIPWPDVVEL